MPRPVTTAPPARSTRERALDVALDLFVERGYDQTSLREVAERMGFTKAALYYHFPSKADMLGALHERMHSLMDAPLALLDEGPISIDLFEQFLFACLDEIQANQKLFEMHRVNQAALVKIHIKGHSDKHQDMEDIAKRLFADPAIDEADRLRMAAAFSTALVTPMIIGQWFPGSVQGRLNQTLRDMVQQILRPPQPSPAPWVGARSRRPKVVGPAS